MDREFLESRIALGESTRQIAEASGFCQTTVRHWLKKHRLKTMTATSGLKGVYRHTVCVLCGKPTKRGNRRCPGCYTKIRRYRAKRQAVKMKGSCCERCGWSGVISAFEFHHRDGNEKSFSINSVANKSWGKISSELEKCELLCANCHRIEHSNCEGEAFLREVDAYRRIHVLV